MNHPDPRKLRKVARRLKANKEQRTLSFPAMNIQEDDPACGTLACLAGHWLHIRASDPDVRPFHEAAMEALVAEEREDTVKWKWGGNLLAVDVGLEAAEGSFAEVFRAKSQTRYDLAEWADDNPRLWGNQNGSWLFANSIAWEEAKHPFDESDGLSSIADHMLRIAKRIEALGEIPEDSA